MGGFGDFFKTIGRLGKKIGGSAARIGKKTLGAIERLGNKVLPIAEKVLQVAGGIPVLSQVVEPLKKGVAIAKRGSEMASKGRKGIEDAENLVERGRDAVRNRDLGALKSIAGEGKRMGVGFGSGVRDSVMGVKTAMGRDRRKNL